MFGRTLKFLIGEKKQRSIRRLYRKKIDGIAAGLGKGVNNLTEEQEKMAIAFWKDFGLKLYPGWHRCLSAATGSFDARYVPEDIYYYFIEPRLQRNEMACAYADKNNYSRLFRGTRQPEVIVRNCNGSYYDGEYRRMSPKTAEELILSTCEKIVIKPSLSSGGGRNLIILSSDGRTLFQKERQISASEALAGYKTDFLVQNYVKQHVSTNYLHPSSLNTFRVLTLLFRGEIHTLSSIIRMGTGGSGVDNETAGGISCGIDANGFLKKYSYNKPFRKAAVHPTTGVEFEGYEIPVFRKVANLCETLHEGLPYFNLLSWDVALDEQAEPVLIEVNIKGQGINFHQLNNGPLFNDMTEELMKELMRTNLDKSLL